jgi:hypothetical protein
MAIAKFTEVYFAGHSEMFGNNGPPEDFRGPRGQWGAHSLKGDRAGLHSWGMMHVDGVVLGGDGGGGLR